MEVTDVQERELRELVAAELAQLEQEGYVVDEARRRWQRDGSGYSAARLEGFLDELRSLPKDAGFVYQEPEELGAILCQTTEEPRWPVPEGAKLQERIYGAWLGRVAGCMLGGAVEGWPDHAIRRYLNGAGEWPLNDYFPYLPEKMPEPFVMGERNRLVTRPYLDRGVRDDDLDYTVLALRLLEEKGPKFTTADVGDAWLTHLPYYMVCTAERVAYRNLVTGLVPPHTAVFRNPYREWIGARIRTDLYGMVNPGHPRRAAEMAFRDATLSHTKNGVYSAMFQAAAVAAALATGDPAAAVEAGAAHVPPASRTHALIREALELWRSGCGWEEAWRELSARWGGYHWVHSLNNLAAELVGLLWGATDFDRAVTLAVMCGLDTDCNGASVGAIVGAAVGASGIDGRWKDPLHDRLDTALFQEAHCRISDLAARTAALAEGMGPRRLCG